MYVTFHLEAQAVKVAIKMRSHRKMSKIGSCWTPNFRGGYTPNFGHAFSNRTHFRTCGKFWL